jgi:formylglycine-generating enzyme required for sulfatase activity
VRDATLPVVTVDAPREGETVSPGSVTVRGHVVDATACVVRVGGVVAQVAGDVWQAVVPVAAEGAKVTVEATDAAGNRSAPVVRSLRASAPAAVPAPTPAFTPPPPATPFAGLAPRGPNAAGREEFALEKDPSVVLVLVPAGSFTMGAGDREVAGRDDEKPARRVTVSAFLVARDEVTWEQWDRFCEATGRRKPDRPKGAKGDHPATGLRFSDARAWCTWAGLRLPTEAEWERAARGGVDGAIFPWGNEVTPRAPAANVFDESRVKKTPSLATKAHFAGHDDGFPATSPVGSFAPNGFGLRDVVGNVWEWCADAYDAKAYARLPALDPSSSGKDGPRVARGGAFNSPPPDCRLARRIALDPERANDDVGLRPARDAK